MGSILHKGHKITLFSHPNSTVPYLIILPFASPLQSNNLTDLVAILTRSARDTIKAATHYIVHKTYLYPGQSILNLLETHEVTTDLQTITKMLQTAKSHIIDRQMRPNTVFLPVKLSLNRASFNIFTLI